MMIKSMIYFILFVIVGALIVSPLIGVTAMALQEEVIEPVEGVSGFLDVLVELVKGYYVSAAILFAFISGATELIGRFTGIKKKEEKTRKDKLISQVQSWLVSIIVCVFGSYFNIGIFEVIVIHPIIDGVIAGFVFGLGVNGFYDFLQNTSGTYVEMTSNK
jgi:hypothetical protein